MAEVESGALGGAAQGAMAGAALGPIGMAGGAVLGGIVGGMGGKGAKKSRKAAEGAARERHALNVQNYNRTAEIVNPASIQAMMQTDRAIQVQERNIGRQEKMIAEIDPTIIEASQQALKLLRGEEASVIAPLRNQRNLQRQKLLNTLRQQMGPGAETSTAGIQALTRFDMETDTLFAGAQQNALGQMGQTFGQFNSGRPNMGGEARTLADLAGSRAQIATNQATALSNAASGVASSAGAGYLGQMMAGQTQQANFNNLLNAGTSLGAAYLTKNGVGEWKNPFSGMFGGEASKPSTSAMFNSGGPGQYLVKG